MANYEKYTGSQGEQEQVRMIYQLQFSAGTIVAVAGYFSTDDQYQHVIVATTNGKLREIYWKSGGAGAGQDDLPVQFSAGTIVAVAGYFTY